MIGALFGDITGSKYEFNNIRTKSFNLMDDDCFFTDDSVCTCAFMDFLLHSKEKDEASATKYLHKWTLAYPGRGYGGNFYHWIHSNNPMPYGSFGNGSAMRVSSVAWAAKDMDELVALTNTITNITHNHPEGLKGALVTATCIYMALHNKTKDEIKEYATKEYPQIASFTYDDLRHNYGFYEICQKSVPEAIFSFLISEDFYDCAKTTISIGGDCDTTAAISMAIAEAYYGVPVEAYNFVKSHVSKEMSDLIEEFETVYGNKRIN